jgi:hypothetical protein
MPKRFTDTEKWKKPFIRGLQGPYKLLWFYILDDCDHAGIWQIDMEVACIRIGENVTLDGACEAFGDHIFLIDQGKLFVPDFISFQYGELKEVNRMHASVISILKKFNLYNPEQGATKPLVSPFQGAKDKDKDKVKDKDKEQYKVKVKETRAEIIFPFDSVAFKNAWGAWIIYRDQIKKPYKSDMAIQAALKKLSEHPEEVAIKMIEESISNQWQGIFEIKKTGNNGFASKQQERTNGLITSFAERAMQHFGGGQPKGGQ